MYRLSVAALIAFAAGILQAQNPPASYPGGNSVLVDFYASVDGQSVDDLTDADVRVLEDGVLQTTQSLEHVRHPFGGSDPRTFLLFVDTLHSQIEASSSLRLPLIRFIDRLMGADDRVALVTPEVAGDILDFGKKSGVISNIMQADWTWSRRGRPEQRDEKEKLYEACYGAARIGQTVVAAEMIARRREQGALDALAGLVNRASDLDPGRKTLLVISDGWQLFRPNASLATGEPGREQTRDVFRRQPRSAPTDSASSLVNRAECEADRVALARMDHTQRLREIAENANRINLTFYSIYASGLGAEGTGAGRGRSEGADPRVGQDALRFLADNTDGTAALDGVDVEPSLQRVSDDVASYYLLTYTSTNTKLDGRFRAIDVRVSRPGVRVRHRRGYRGRTADELIESSGGSGAPASTSAAVLTVPTPSNRSQFRIRTSAWSRPADAGEPEGGFWVVGEIDYRTRRELAWTSGATADIRVVAADGTEVLSRSASIRTEDGPFGFEVPESGGLPPGEYAVSVQLRSDADTTMTLADTARVVLGPPTGLGEAVFWRRGPTTGLQHRRTADPQFQRSDRLRLELPSTVDGTPAARMLDRNGARLNVPVLVTVRDDAPDGLHWVVVDASLAPLAPGDYSIEVTQGSARQLTQFRIVP